MKLTTTLSRTRKPETHAAIIFVRAAESGPRRVSEPADAAVDRWLRDRRFGGNAGEACLLPPDAGHPEGGRLLAGLGAEWPAPARAYEAAATAAVYAARNAGLRSVTLPMVDPAFARGLARGAAEGNYRIERYRERTRGQRHPPVAELHVVGLIEKQRGVMRDLHDGLAEGEQLNIVREIANLPGNEGYPEDMARAARSIARATGLSCEVHGPAALERLGMRVMLAVGRGSSHAPRLIVLRHAPKKSGRSKPVVLVGKTITFDSGGISLKPGAGMGWMRYDKCGGMAVLGAMAVLARLKVPVPVIGLLAAAENMPDGDATRPGDIIRAHNGKTVEILNTDAEGRLVLADALSFAAKWKPRAMIDLATLTGAAIVALGHHAAAMLSPDEALGRALQTAGDAVGERLWPLPLWPEYGKALRSRFADVKNIGEGGAGTILGGAFLQAFVPEGVPWAHLDIAGTAWNESESGLREPGATLFGARLLVEWIRSL